MAFALIWLESLAAFLLFEAVVVAVAARWRRGWWWRAVPLVVAVQLLALAWAVSGSAWIINSQGVQKGHGVTLLAPGNPDFWKATTEAAIPTSTVVYSVAWTAALTFGTVALYWCGLRRTGEPPAPPARTWSRRRVLAAWAVAVVLTAITFANMDQAVKVQLTSVRAEAGAIALSHAPPRLPDRDNAALLYRRAFEALPPLPAPLPDEPDTSRYDKWEAWQNYDKAKIDPKDKDLRDYLRARQAGLALARKAAALPGCSFDYNYLNMGSLLIQEIQDLRNAAADLALDAYVKASDGDAAGALDDVAAMYGIAGHCNDSFLVALLVAVWVEKTAARVLEDVLTLTAPRAEDLARLPLDSGAAYQVRLHRALEMEEAMGLSSFGGLGSVDTGWLRSIRFYDGPEWLLEDVWLPLYRVFLLSDDLAGYRRMMKIYQNTTHVPNHDAPPGWWHQESEVLMSRSGVLTRILIPAVNKYRQAAAQGDAARRLAQVAVALTAYRAKNGSYPAKLDALVPDYLLQVPIDPFDGKPLRLKADGKGAVVYSVGPDGVDDGGQLWDADKQRGDLVFRLKP